jgi:hypothetical protein
MIVFLSDHGEEFYDHGGFGHGHTLYDELIKVPLMFSLPGKLAERKRVSQQVRLLDITPTILDLLEITPWTHLEGVSLVPIMAGTGDVDSSSTNLLPHQFAYSEAMLFGTEKKSVTAYPWKLIYDTATEEVTLVDLSRDPGETGNLGYVEPEIKALFEDVLLRTFLATSETWFVEAATQKEAHVFDLMVSLTWKPMSGSFSLYRFLDSDGRIVDASRIRLAEASNNVLRIEGMELKGCLTLAFVTEPGLCPVIFDFKIDDKPAERVTFVGEALSLPDAMPFMEQATRTSRVMGVPPGRPEPPYVLVWHSKNEFGASTPVRLTGMTERELRTLGYIQ